jgi:hypothetical protein
MPIRSAWDAGESSIEERLCDSPADCDHASRLGTTPNRASERAGAARGNGACNTPILGDRSWFLRRMLRHLAEGRKMQAERTFSVEPVRGDEEKRKRRQASRGSGGECLALARQRNQSFHFGSTGSQMPNPKLSTDEYDPLSHT